MRLVQKILFMLVISLLIENGCASITDFSSPKFRSVYQNVIGGAPLPEADELPSLYKIRKIVPKFAPKINIKLGIYYLSTGDEMEAIPLLRSGLQHHDGLEYAHYILSDDEQLMNKIDCDNKPTNQKLVTIDIENVINQLRSLYQKSKK